MGLILDHIFILGAFEMNEIIWDQELLAYIESAVDKQLMDLNCKI